MDAIRGADIFSSIVGLRYGGYWRHKTILGGIVGLTAITMSCAILFVFFYGFFSRTDRRVNLQIEKQWSPPAITLDSAFPFGVYIYYGSSLEDNQDVISISADIVTRDLSTGKEKLTPIPVEKCLSSNFPNLEDNFSQLKLSQAYCPKIDQVQIEGGNVSDRFTYIQVNFDICALKGNSSNCLSLEKSLQKLDSAFPIAHFFTIDSSFETNNYPDTVRKFINNVNVKLTSGDSKETDIFISKDKLSIRDIGLTDGISDVFEEFVLVGIPNPQSPTRKAIP